MSYILTLDAGTGGGRAIVFDLEGRVIARAYETWHYEISEPQDLPFVRECSFEPEVFWTLLCRCVRHVLTDAGVRADSVGAVVTTSQREGCVFLDAAGREIYAGPNVDARGAMEAIEAQQLIGAERLHNITGHAPPFIFPMARYLWFRKNRPSDSVHRILMISDWLAYRLTGETGMEPSNAGESMLFDVSRREWSAEILDTLEIPAGVLPVLRQAGDRIGAVSTAAAEATLLRPGTPVVVGGADTQVALLGSGAIEPGQTGLVLGSTAPVQMVLGEPLVDRGGNLWTGCHVVPERWVLESNGGDSGSAYTWLLELLGASETSDPHATAEGWVRPPDPSQRGPFMYVGPAVFNLANMNPYRPAGVLFPYPLMEVGRPDRGALVRAFFENIAFAVRGNSEQISAVAGRPVGHLLVSGGMSRGRLLMQIIADVMDDAIQVSDVAESAALGCAVLGAVGLGVYPNLSAATAAMVRSSTVEPRTKGSYVQQYAKWREFTTVLEGMTV